MPENGTKKPNTTLAAAVVDLVDRKENEDYIVCKVGSCKKSLHKYMIILDVPNIAKMIAKGATLEDLGKWFLENRNLSLQDTVNTAVRNLSYKPPYQEVGFDFDAEPITTEDPTDPENPYIDHPLKEGGHKAMQELADAYKAGQRAAASATQKAKASKLDSIEERAAAAGTTIEDILAKLEKAQAKSKKK